MSLDVLRDASAVQREVIEALFQGVHCLGHQRVEGGNEFWRDIHALVLLSRNVFHPLIEGCLASPQKRMRQDTDGEAVGVGVASAEFVEDFGGGLLPFVHIRRDATVRFLADDVGAEMGHLSQLLRDFIGFKRLDDGVQQWHGVCGVAHGFDHGVENLMQGIGVDGIHCGEIVEQGTP